MRDINIGSLIIVLLTLASCALPAPEFENQQFVAKKDVVVNSLYKEGVNLYRAGRFLDSELRLRQAVYLYPSAETLKSNLALVLKSSGLYLEADSIYKDLIARYPEAYDYKYALADSFYRQREFEKAARLYQELMLDYEKLNDHNKAAQSARSLASLEFLAGDEGGSLCASNQALVYAPAQDQILRHIKILLALGYYKSAHEQLLPLIEAPSEIKDPAIFKTAGLVFFSIDDLEQTKKFLTLSKENQTAGLKEPDAELEKLRELIEYKYPEEKVADEEEDAEEEDEKAQLIFNEQSLLYWPAPLVRLYYEHKAATETEES